MIQKNKITHYIIHFFHFVSTFGILFLFFFVLFDSTLTLTLCEMKVISNNDVLFATVIVWVFAILPIDAYMNFWDVLNVRNSIKIFATFLLFSIIVYVTYTFYFRWLGNPFSDRFGLEVCGVIRNPSKMEFYTSLVMVALENLKMLDPGFANYLDHTFVVLSSSACEFVSYHQIPHVATSTVDNIYGRYLETLDSPSYWAFAFYVVSLTACYLIIYKLMS